MDNTKADKPERRTALVARELARYNMDLAALRETPFVATGLLPTERGIHDFLEWPKQCRTT